MRAAGFRPCAIHALIELLAIETEVARAHGNRAGRADRPPPIGDRAHRGVRCADRVLGAGKDRWRAQHRRRDRQLGQIMSGLRIDQG